MLILRNNIKRANICVGLGIHSGKQKENTNKENVKIEHKIGLYFAYNDGTRSAFNVHCSNRSVC